MSPGTLVSLAWLLASLSLAAVGGGNTILPELHRQAVSVHGWLTDAQFASAFAISQAAPGPSSALIAALIGLKAAGWLGAIVASLAMLIPAAALTCVASLAWERFRDSPWRVAVQRGLAPVALGLLIASALVVVRAADHGWPALLVTGLSTVLLGATRINPLLVMAGAGFLGWLGFVF